MRNKLFSLLAAFTLVLSLTAIAQDKGGKSVTLTGNILDVACSAKATTAEAAAGHKKGCALSGNCLKSGLGVFADGKFTAFDEAGTAKGKAALEATSKANGAKFKVMGKMMDGKLAVDSISEVE
jgi:hypothetical protein